MRGWCRDQTRRRLGSHTAIQRVGAKSHLVRSAQTHLNKVEVKLKLERLAIPLVELEVLQVIASDAVVLSQFARSEEV